MILGLLFLLNGNPAKAQQICGPKEGIGRALNEGFGEVPVWRGLVGPNMMMELWVATDGGTWSFVGNRADGVSCVMSSGDTHAEVAPTFPLHPGSFVPINHTTDHNCFPWAKVESQYVDDPRVLVGTVPYDVFRTHLGFDSGWPDGVDEVGLVGGLETGLGTVFPIRKGCYIDELVTMTSLRHVQQLLDFSL